MSARAFYESIYVHEYVARYLNLRDLNRLMSDRDRIKVTENCLLVIVILCSVCLPQFEVFEKCMSKRIEDL